MEQQHLQDLPPEVRSKIYKKLDTESLLKFGESGTRFIPEILRSLTFPKQKTLWFSSVKYSFCKWIKIMIALGFDVNVKENDGGWAALHHAVYRGYLDILKLLINAGADINAKNYGGSTALHFATDWGNLDIVKLLINAGADVGTKNNDGLTALHYAAEGEHLDIMKELIVAGADVNAKDNDGWTALHISANEGYLDCVKLLINKGADRNIKNNRGETAYDVARNLRIKTYLKFRF